MTSLPTPDVAAAFETYSPKLRERMLELRELILETAANTEGVGAIEEALRWGEPSYLTTQSKSGTTIRVAGVRGSDHHYAMFVNCQTNLLQTYRVMFEGVLSFDGDRAVVFDVADPLPAEAVGACIALALRYHADKKRRARAN